MRACAVRPRCISINGRQTGLPHLTRLVLKKAVQVASKITSSFSAPTYSVALVLFTAGLASAATVSLPFSDDFNDTSVGPWVANGGTWTHNGSTLGFVTDAFIDSNTVETPDLGGSNTTDFTVSETIKVNSSSSNPGMGFGLLSTSADLAAVGNEYYLIDIVPGSGGQLRIGEIKITGATTLALGDSSIVTTPMTFSLGETYTISVDVTYGVSDLTIKATLNSDDDDSNVVVSLTDPTPLTGQHMGMETYVAGASSADIDFDNFNITAVPEPSSMLLLLPASILAIRFRRKGGC